MYSAPIKEWSRAFEAGGSRALQTQLLHCYGREEAQVWRRRYLEALRAFAGCYGAEGEVVIARCPGQMNIMGMHIDYGGMPSLRLAVRGADTLTIARPAPCARVRLRNVLAVPGEPADRFAPVEFDLDEIVPGERVGTRRALMDYAGRVCGEREARTGSTQEHEWGILPQGQLIYLESYFRDRKKMRGFDALVWSNVSPSGGMSSSSALVISTALAVLGVNDLEPGKDLSEEELVDGVGTSEWIRGTRGGTADHGGMVLGRAGRLVRVGVFPARVLGYAQMPPEYVALILDSGVPRVYDEAGKEETVIAYPLGTFLVRDVLLPQWAGESQWRGLGPEFKERIEFIRDITAENLGFDGAEIYQVLAGLPRCTTLKEVEARAKAAGAGAAYAAMYEREIAGKFRLMGPGDPIYLRRRFAFGLAEQDRVAAMQEYMNAGDMATALELVRIAHEGDRDREVEDRVLAERYARARRGEKRARLCFLPGGYGRMTPEYDRVARTINAYLLERGGAGAGSVQRLGAGWGGNVGGLVERDFIFGRERAGLARLLEEELDMEAGLEEGIAVPGEGACLLKAPEPDE